MTCFFSALREDEERRVKMGNALAMAQAEANTSERSHTIWRGSTKVSQWAMQMSQHYFKYKSGKYGS